MKTININGEIIPNDYAWYYDWYEREYTCPANIKDILGTLEDGEDITITINSGGGDVVGAQEMYSMLKKASSQGHKVIVEVQSIAASAASLIAVAGDVVRMSPSSELMIHNCSTYAEGDYHVMLHTADVLQAIDETIMAAYSEKTGIPYDKLREMMDGETWLPSNKCLEHGFADEIIRDKNPGLITNAMLGCLSITPDMMAKAKAAKAAKDAADAAAEAEKAAILNDLDMYGV